MLQWRGGGRTVAHDPAALREIGYIHEERSAIHEHDGGLDGEVWPPVEGGPRRRVLESAI